AERIDLNPVRPGLPAQEAVVLVLDPRLADRVAGLEAGVPRLVELLSGHLADVPKEVRRDVPLLVLAGEDPLDADAREVVLVLAQVVDVVGGQALGEDHRSARRISSDRKSTRLNSSH